MIRVEMKPYGGFSLVAETEEDKKAMAIFYGNLGNTYVIMNGDADRNGVRSVDFVRQTIPQNV